MFTLVVFSGTFSVRSITDVIERVENEAKETAMTVENADRYLKIVAWARRRYADRVTGRILISTTRGGPSIYSRIETAAFRRYA
jgi:hypothetical protein